MVVGALVKPITPLLLWLVTMTHYPQTWQGRCQFGVMTLATIHSLMHHADDLLTCIILLLNSTMELTKVQEQ